MDLRRGFSKQLTRPSLVFVRDAGPLAELFTKNLLRLTHSVDLYRRKDSLSLRVVLLRVDRMRVETLTVAQMFSIIPGDEEARVPY